MEKTANIPKSWILLYMCSTVSISNNINLGPNVRDCQPDQVLPAITNGGSQFYQQIADLIMLPVTVHIKMIQWLAFCCLKMYLPFHVQ